MKDYWKTFHRKINHLSLRERRLVALTSAGVFITLLVSFVCIPAYNKWDETYSQNRDYENNINQVSDEIKLVMNQSKRDVDAPHKARIKSLEALMQQQEGAIHNITATLIQPRNMNLVFKTMMSKNNLSLVKFKNLPAKKVKIDSSKEDDQPLYKHEFRLHLSGKYFSFLSFIEQLEGQKWQLNWESLDIKIIDYPYSELVLKYHTLSTSKTVLGL